MKLSALELYQFAKMIIDLSDKVAEKGMGKTYIATDLNVRVWEKLLNGRMVYTVTGKDWKFAVQRNFPEHVLLFSHGVVTDIESVMVLAKLMA